MEEQSFLYPTPVIMNQCPEEHTTHKDYGEYLLQSGRWKHNRLRRKKNKRK